MEGLLIWVGHVVPRVGVARVLVEGLATDEKVADLRTPGDKVPELVFDNRAAGAGVVVPVPLVRIDGRQAQVFHALGEVAPLQPGVRVAAEEGRPERIAAIARDVVDACAARGPVRGHAGGIERDFHRGCRISERHVDRLTTHERARSHTVDHDARVAEAVDRGNAVQWLGGRAADVPGGRDRTRHERAQPLRRPIGRQRVDQLVVEHRLLCGRLDVDDRCRAGDGDGFCNRADFQLRVDRNRLRAGQLDFVAPDDVEPGEHEADGIGAWPQIFDLVLAGAVGGDRSNLFNEHRAGGLDRDAWHDGARRIFGDPCK